MVSGLYICLSGIKNIVLTIKFMGNLVLKVLEVFKSSASMRITFLVRRSGQKMSSARMILTFLVTAENLVTVVRVWYKVLEFMIKFKFMYVSL